MPPIPSVQTASRTAAASSSERQPLVASVASVALVALACLGCGPGVQRAMLVNVPAAPAAVAAPAAAASLDVVRPAASRYVVSPRGSRFEIYASDSFTGEHRITFDRWSAHVEVVPVPRIVLEVDLDSLHVDVAAADSIVKSRLLEIDKYPRATFVATIAKTDGPAGQHVIEGVADIHGVKRGLRVLGTLAQEAENYRFKTVFTVSRRWFGIRYGGTLEAFLSDEVRIVVDALARPERVTVEEVPVPSPPVPPP